MYDHPHHSVLYHNTLCLSLTLPGVRDSLYVQMVKQPHQLQPVTPPHTPPTVA